MGRGLQPFERGEALGDAAGLCLAEPRESDQPLEIALVHRRVGVHVLLKARCIVRITPSIQSVNMAFRRATSRRSRRDPPGLPRGPAGRPCQTGRAGSSPRVARVPAPDLRLRVTGAAPPRSPYLGPGPPSDSGYDNRTLI